MFGDVVSLFLFAFATSFSPGPNTISSASMGLSFGYKRSFKYLLGIAVGFFFIMLCCSLLSAIIQQELPRVVPTLSYIGALYIFYLAYHTLRSGGSLIKGEARPLGFVRGFMLQVVNPKVIILGITVYTTFLAEMPHSWFNLIFSAFGFTIMSFTAVSTWARFGSLIGDLMQQERTRKIINTILALSLCYVAIRMMVQA
ncbi:MAG: LysE family translocator [Sphaerochaeta sp.]|nr:LysE family translocator [Sphaerochaeta sp.]